MFNRIKLVWRSRRIIVPLLRGLERLAAASTAKPKHMGLIHNLNPTFFHAVLHLVTLHSVKEAEALLIAMHNIDHTWES